jgi:hypothetical protein
MMSPLRGKQRYCGLSLLVGIAKGILVPKRREQQPSLLHRDPSTVSKRQYSDRSRQRGLAAGIEPRGQLWLCRTLEG